MQTRHECAGCGGRWSKKLRTSGTSFALLAKVDAGPRIIVPAIVSPCCKPQPQDD